MGRNGVISRKCLGPIPSSVQAIGYYEKSVPLPKKTTSGPDGIWYDDLSAFERVYYHQTQNSALRFAGFRQYP